ncbi:pentapeptide repeat-containing protein [Salmonella enterica]|nr:pentapeptide repeat-containing protein [Salmonella enterica]
MNRKKISTAGLHTFADEHFDSIDFSEAELNKDNMSDTVFQSCNFYNSETQSGCSFHGCKLRNAVFINCDLTLCRFAFADLFGAEPYCTG